MSIKKNTNVNPARAAIDAVRARVSIDDIAKEAGASRHAIIATTLPQDKAGYRVPPANLTGALIVLCDRQAQYFSELAAKLRKG